MKPVYARNSMEQYQLLLEQEFDNIVVRYLMDEEGRVAMLMIPVNLRNDVNLDKAIGLDSIVDIQFQGYPYASGWGVGRTERHGSRPATKKSDYFDPDEIHLFFYKSHEIIKNNLSINIKTILVNNLGFEIEHNLSWHYGEQAVEVNTIFSNCSNKPITIEMISSFVLGGITPFCEGVASDTLNLHRIRSSWSAEGRHVKHSIEDMHLERSWLGISKQVERFGQIGTMPVRGYFPFIAVEDQKKKVFWGAQLAWAGSWQMEALRIDDALSISGGHADREFGHWTKTVRPGEKFVSPRAILSTVQGNIDDLTQSLVSVQKKYVPNTPSYESELPIIFNEFCSTWGDPTADKIKKMADSLTGKGIDYLVIDAGWYSEPDEGWGSGKGDWLPNLKRFPNGLKEVFDYIKKHKMVPGLWFEFENCHPGAMNYDKKSNLLQKDGEILTVGTNRFLDMRKPSVHKFLNERVIQLLSDIEAGYIKIDYNNTTGIGVDGAESLGEGLRQHIEGVYTFLDKLREKCPDLVIENCSSGGHRLEPSMFEKTNMSSFSDAHETLSIPIIAANLHRVMLPRQNQVWAVLRPEDNLKRFTYILTSTFLGRMCISGDVDSLTDLQWQRVDESIKFYKNVRNIIKEGYTQRFGPIISSYIDINGWQIIKRVNERENELMVIVHAFGGELPEMIEIPLPDKGNWILKNQFPNNIDKFVPGQNTLYCKLDENFEGYAGHFVLKKD